MYYLVEITSGSGSEPAFKNERDGTWKFLSMDAYEKAPIEPFKVLRTLGPSEDERNDNNIDDLKRLKMFKIICEIALGMFAMAIIWYIWKV